MMDSGAYRGLVTFQKYVEGFDEIGNPSHDWQDYKNAYAYVNGLSGRLPWFTVKIRSSSFLGGNHSLIS